MSAPAGQSQRYQLVLLTELAHALPRGLHGQACEKGHSRPGAQQRIQDGLVSKVQQVAYATPLEADAELDMVQGKC